MKKIIYFAVLLCFCYSCKMPQYIPVETVKTVLRDNFIRDSIFRYDSVFVKQKADTLIMERYRYFYRDKLIRDSIHINDTIKVPYPVEVVKRAKKQLSGWQNFQIWCGRITLVVGLFAIIYFVLRLKKRWLF